MGENLPIVYVRGFGGGQSGIDRAVDDPFYGFNEGATHIRVGAMGEPRFYQFEGPMLRLLLQQQYTLRVGGSQQQQLLEAEAGALPPESVWIYRFYDASAGTFGQEPVPYKIGESAKGLADFIALVREKTVGNPRVNLVAHSMGGLICRTALQREIHQPEQVVSKFCTFGTPHGGIDPELGGGIGDWVIEKFGPNGSDVFSPKRMQEYMLPEGYDFAGDVNRKTGDWDPRIMVGSFPVSRVLSVVGTNPQDYDAAHGLSAKAMGVQSDGLVAIRNAYVRGSARSYVHRSHSGRYGLVNSEEAYQNLRRFLFGAMRVEIKLEGLDAGRLGTRVWQADARLAIRELPVLIHEQTAEHHCPVDLNAEAGKVATPMAPVPLITMFLMNNKDRCRYALSLKVVSLEEHHGLFGFHDHLEQIGDWEDSLVVDVLVEDGVARGVDWAWSSSLGGRIADAQTLGNPLTWEPADPKNPQGGWEPTVPMPPTAKNLLGDDAQLRLSVTLWD
ncbi:MAG: hypothetical protein QOH80_516 [Actinomycetota bacterium]|jgi:pimeloyl-ACP methyl ester carboxylesterase|nr:hypothetical protein [Actinomycetota bacterium]